MVSVDTMDNFVKGVVVENDTEVGVVVVDKVGVVVVDKVGVVVVDKVGVVVVDIV
jgi:hypothetical protein